MSSKTLIINICLKNNLNPSRSKSPGNTESSLKVTLKPTKCQFFANNAPLLAWAIISSAWSTLLCCTGHVVGSTMSITFLSKRDVKADWSPHIFGVQALAEKPVGWEIMGNQNSHLSQNHFFFIFVFWLFVLIRKLWMLLDRGNIWPIH